MDKLKGVQRWEAEVSRLEMRAPATKPICATVFLGSSTFRLWRGLENDLAAFNAVNNGFGGARIKDLHHYAERLVKPWAPSMVVLYGGGNDVARGASGVNVGAQYKELIARVRTLSASVHVCVMTVLPHPAFETAYTELESLNAASGDEADSVIDVWHPLLASDRKVMTPLFSEDKIHLNADGYEWLKRQAINHLNKVKAV